MRFFVLAAIFCGMLAPMSTYAQQVAKNATVSGTVCDSYGELLMGAGVVVKGTSYGCITDLDGNFTLEGVSYPVTLVASFIGLTEKEVTVKICNATVGCALYNNACSHKEFTVGVTNRTFYSSILRTYLLGVH